EQAGDPVRRDGGPAAVLRAAPGNGPAPLQHEPRVRADGEGGGPLRPPRQGPASRESGAAAADVQGGEVVPDPRDVEAVSVAGDARHEEVTRASSCPFFRPYHFRSGSRSRMRPVAVITGAGHGIGRGLAIQLARDGYAIAAIDVD